MSCSGRGLRKRRSLAAELSVGHTERTKDREGEGGGRQQAVRLMIDAATQPGGPLGAEVAVGIRRVTPPAFEGQASRHAFVSAGAMTLRALRWPC
jgi:hypothetical protein